MQSIIIVINNNNNNNNNKSELQLINSSQLQLAQGRTS